MALFLVPTFNPRLRFVFTICGHNLVNIATKLECWANLLSVGHFSSSSSTLHSRDDKCSHQSQVTSAVTTSNNGILIANSDKYLVSSIQFVLLLLPEQRLKIYEFFGFFFFFNFRCI